MVGRRRRSGGMRERSLTAAVGTATVGSAVEISDPLLQRTPAASTIGTPGVTPPRTPLTAASLRSAAAAQSFAASSPFLGQASPPQASRHAEESASEACSESDSFASSLTGSLYASRPLHPPPQPPPPPPPPQPLPRPPQPPPHLVALRAAPLVANPAMGRDPALATSSVNDVAMATVMDSANGLSTSPQGALQSAEEAARERETAEAAEAAEAAVSEAERARADGTCGGGGGESSRGGGQGRGRGETSRCRAEAERQAQVEQARLQAAAMAEATLMARREAASPALASPALGGGDDDNTRNRHGSGGGGGDGRAGIGSAAPPQAASLPDPDTRPYATRLLHALGICPPGERHEDIDAPSPDLSPAHADPRPDDEPPSNHGRVTSATEGAALEAPHDAPLSDGARTQLQTI